MRKSFRSVAMALAVTAAWGGTMQGQVGKTWPAERKPVPNAKYGHEVVQWTSTGRNNHLYFNEESFPDNDHFMFYSDRSGKMNLFRMNMKDGTMTQMTDETELRQNAWYDVARKTLWFAAGKAIKTLDVTTLKTQTVHTFEGGAPESFTVTCDGKYFVYGENKNPGYSANHSTGPYAIFRLDVASGEIKQISPDFGFRVGHMQASPVDPNHVMYCWSHVYTKGGAGTVGNIPHRIWWNNVEGTDGGPVGIQEFGIHRTHEFWFPDGKHIGYAARYHFGPNKGRQFIGIITPKGEENVMMEAPVLSSHSQVLPDNTHWVSDLYDGKNLVLFTIDGKKILKSEILFNHESTMEGQPSHPHPHFSPDGKVVLFSTDRTGSPQVYTVAVDAAK